MYRKFIPPYFFSLHTCCNLNPMARPSLIKKKNEIWSYADLNSARQTHADKGITFSSQRAVSDNSQIITPGSWESPLGPWKRISPSPPTMTGMASSFWIFWVFFSGSFVLFKMVFFFGVFGVFVDNSFRSRFQRNQFPDDFAKVETDIDSKEIPFFSPIQNPPECKC